MKWDDFFEVIPKEWSPGLNSPFDPTAARLAKHSNIEVAMINGEYLGRLVDYLGGKPFVGTRLY
jgi:uridylate kinase